MGDSTKAFDLGFRVGALLGYRVSRSLSLSGELTADIFNSNTVQGGEKLVAKAVDFGPSPLFHLALDRGVLVIGPKIGAFRYTSSLESWAGTTPVQTSYGLAYGLNVGVFGAVGDVALGALLGYTGRHASAVTCGELRKDTSTYYDPCLLGGSDIKLLSATVAALF